VHPRARCGVHACAAAYEYVHTGSAHQPMHESDIKALPAGGGDPQCNTQADVEAARRAAGIAAAGRDLHCQPWGSRPCAGLRGEPRRPQGWAWGLSPGLAGGGHRGSVTRSGGASRAAGAQAGSGVLPPDPPGAGVLP